MLLLKARILFVRAEAPFTFGSKPKLGCAYDFVRETPLPPDDLADAGDPSYHTYGDNEFAIM